MNVDYKQRILELESLVNILSIVVSNQSSSIQRLSKEINKQNQYVQIMENSTTEEIIQRLLLHKPEHGENGHEVQ